MYTVPGILQFTLRYVVQPDRQLLEEIADGIVGDLSQRMWPTTTGYMHIGTLMRTWIPSHAREYLIVDGSFRFKRRLQPFWL